MRLKDRGNFIIMSIETGQFGELFSREGSFLVRVTIVVVKHPDKATWGRGEGGEGFIRFTFSHHCST